MMPMSLRTCIVIMSNSIHKLNDIAHQRASHSFTHDVAHSITGMITLISRVGNGPTHRSDGNHRHGRSLVKLTRRLIFRASSRRLWIAWDGRIITQSTSSSTALAHVRQSHSTEEQILRQSLPSNTSTTSHHLLCPRTGTIKKIQRMHFFHCTVALTKLLRD